MISVELACTATRMIRLREVALASQVYYIGLLRRPPSYRRFSLKASFAMVANISASATKCSPFLGENVHVREGFRKVLYFYRALTLRRIHNDPVRCSGVAGQPDKSRGGFPRFHVETLPAYEGMSARVEGDEFSHMVKVLRLKVKDRVELFDGRGGIVNGQLMSISRNAAEVTSVENLQMLCPVAPHLHVAAAFCSLKGGRGEWLVEKCTELGARTLTPLLTKRSSSVTGGRKDRWQRIAMAATKQCQRLHNLDIREPILLHSFLPQVSEVEVAFVAAAGAPPLSESLARIPNAPQSGMLFIGPEGDFTPDELNLLINIGAMPVGLGPRRLRVETATVALLATVMLMVTERPCQSEVQK